MRLKLVTSIIIIINHSSPPAEYRFRRYPLVPKKKPGKGTEFSLLHRATTYVVFPFLCQFILLWLTKTFNFQKHVLLMKLYLYFEIGYSIIGFIYSIAFLTKETASELFLVLFQLSKCIIMYIPTYVHTIILLLHSLLTHTLFTSILAYCSLLRLKNT